MGPTVSARRIIGAAVCALLMFVTAAGAEETQRPFKKEEIEQLVAPIALYPDALVAQILMASTYPLEVVSAARWSKANPKVSGKALEDAMQKQTWDPSVKSLTAVPQALAMMNEKLDWTQKLGDAFLAQQNEVMGAIQRLRVKAKEAGNLKSGKEQVVKTEQEEGTTVIKIEQADPQVIYVPTYNPTVVYGAWPYPAYPPYYYYPPGYSAGAVAFSFSVGVAVGSAMWGGVRWGGSSANVYINRTNYNSFNRTTVNNANWQHNPEHRQGTQYRDAASQNKYGGQRTGAESREAYRGHADAARQDVSASGAQRSSAFDGAGSGAQARAESSRGASSVASAGSYSGGASGSAGRAGAGAGAGARGGGRGGGGRR